MRRLCLLAPVLLTAAILTACGGSSSPSSSAPRTVTVNWVDTYWSPSGKVQVPQPASAALNIEALVPQPDGSVTLLHSSATSTPGVFTIANVPAGNYWLAAGTGGAFWTGTSTFDAGSDISIGPPPFASTPSNTTFDFNISGIAPETTTEWVEFFTDPLSGFSEFSVPPSYTNFVASSGDTSYIDWSQIQTGFLMQYELEPLGPLNNYVLGPELTLSNLALTTGATNPISGTLKAATETSLNLSVSGSQWASAFNNAGPAPATVQDSILTLTAEPYVTGVNAAPYSIALPAFLLIAPTPGGLPFFQQGQLGYFDPEAAVCADFTGEGSAYVVPINPPILTDQNFGALQYSDPFDPTWTRSLALCQQATVPIPIPNSTDTYTFVLVAGGSGAPSNSPLAPIALPVQNPTIAGSSFFTADTVNTVAPVLSWTAPTGTAPYGYRVSVYALLTSQGPPAIDPVATYNTAGTSITLPPLSGGNTYIFTITTEVDGAANMQTSPYRSALPTGFASVVSAPITISSSAAALQIQGDIEKWRRLAHPKRDRQANTDTGIPAPSPCKPKTNSRAANFCMSVSGSAD